MRNLRLDSFSKKKNRVIKVTACVTLISACVTEDHRPNEHSPISLPEAPPGASRAENKVLNRLPEEAQGQDSEIIMPVDTEFSRPLSEMEQRRRESEARKTDQEIIGGSRNLGDRQADGIGKVDKDLGVSSKEQGGQSPSFTLAIQKIKELYTANKIEDALIETNLLLKSYPKSPKLLMMKGTLHQRLGYIDLALVAYERAYEGEPSKKLAAQIQHLKRLISERELLRQKNKEGVVTSKGVQDLKVITPAGKKETK